MSGPSAAWQWALIAILLCAGVVPALVNPVNGDIAWLLYAARRVAEGATLYVDLIEINPPLIVWLSIPAVWLADLLGTSMMTAFTVYVLAIAAGSLMLVNRVLRVGSGLEPASRRGFVALFTLAAITLSGIMFGQREQLMLLATAPYAVLVAARTRGRATSPRTAAGVGVLGGIGFAIKPHFVLVWLALEVLAWFESSDRRVLRPEVLGVVAAGGLYVLAVVLFASEYFTMVQRLGAAYAGFRQEGLGELAATPFTVALLVGIVYYRLAAPGGAARHLVKTAVVFATTALAIVAIQGQGFYYHYYPVLAWVVVTLGLLSWAGVKERQGTGRIPWWLPWGASTAMLIVLAGTAGQSALKDVLDQEYDRRLDRVTAHLRSASPSDSFSLAVVSPQHKSAYPLVNRAGAESVLRFNGFWPITVLCDSACRAEKTYLDGTIREGSEAEAYFRSGTLEDLTSRPPDFLLFDQMEIEDTFPDHPFDYIGYFAADPRVRSVLSGYVCGRRIGGYRICHRRAASESRATGYRARHGRCRGHAPCTEPCNVQGRTASPTTGADSCGGI